MIKARFLQFFFYTPCKLCGGGDRYSQLTAVCKTCVRKLIRPDQSLSGMCPVCKSVLENGKCSYCETRNVFFEKYLFLYEKTQDAKKILQEIKFRSGKPVSLVFRKEYPKIHSELCRLDPSAIVFVPSHRKSLRKRPYHPAFYLAEKVGKRLNIPIVDAVVKKSSELQSGKNYKSRFFHARFAFQIRSKIEGSLKGNILLVDDLFTTGATANEVARILLENGADKVYLLTLLRGYSV